MKKALAVLCAALIIVGIAACSNNTNNGSGGDSSPESSALTKQVTFAAPAEYEVYVQTPNSVTFIVPDEEGNITREIAVVYKPANEGQKGGIASKDLIQLEDGMGADFGDNVKVSFIEIGDYPGVQMDSLGDDGQLVEVCYYLIMEDWLVMVVNGGDLAYLDEMNADMKVLLDSMTLEDLVFA